MGDRVGRRARASCWPSSWSPPANTSSTCRPRCRRGCGCWARRRQSKNDPNDALSTAIAGLRHCGLRPVARRRSHRGAASAGRPPRRPRRAAHPGGVPAACRAARARRRRCTPAFAGRSGRQAAAQRPTRDGGRRSNASASPASCWSTSAVSIATSPPIKTRIADAVAASGTTLLELYGVGPIVAAIILGHVGDPARFPTRDRFASYNGTAPIEASSGPTQAASAQPAREPQAQPRAAPHRGHPDPPRHTRTRLLRPQARRGQDQEGSAPSVEATHQRRRLAPAPSRPRPPLRQRAREDSQGRLFNPAWPALHPERRHFGSVTPGPDHNATPEHEPVTSSSRAPTRPENTP